MTELVRRSFAAAALIGLGMLVGSARAQTRPPAGSATGPVAPSSYTVVLIGEEYKALPTSEVGPERKRLSDEYAKQMKEYSDAVKGEDATVEKPVKVLVRALRKFRKQQDAQAYVDKLRAQDIEAQRIRERADQEKSRSGNGDGDDIHSQAEREMRRISRDVAAKAVREYEIAKRNGSAIDAYVHAGLAAAAFLQAEDEDNYKKWKAIERQDGILAGVPQGR